MRTQHGTALYTRKRVSTSVTSAQKLGAAQSISWPKSKCNNLCYRTAYKALAVQMLSPSFDFALLGGITRSLGQILLAVTGTLVVEAG